LARRFPVANDAIVGVPQYVAFQEAKGEGVVPQDVLPGEKQAPGPDPAGQPHGVSRGQVVRLLVDVDQVGPHAADLLTQTGVEVQVKVPVEDHRLDHQVISGRMLSLQMGHAPFIPPIGRDDSG
jgi:hypothetical protein